MLIDMSVAWTGLIIFVVAAGCFVLWQSVLKPSTANRRAIPMAASPQWVPDANWCMKFARRLERPISLVRVSLPQIGSDQPDGPPNSALEQTLGMVGVELRCTDLIEIGQDESATFSIYCLDTDKAGARTLAKRIKLALQKHGLFGHIVVQTFPEDGYTLRDLDNVASQQLLREKHSEPTVETNPVSAQQA